MGTPLLTGFVKILTVILVQWRNFIFLPPSGPFPAEKQHVGPISWRGPPTKSRLLLLLLWPLNSD